MQGMQLQNHLWRLLDTWVGDCIAERSEAQKAAQGKTLARAATDLAMAVLRHQITHPTAVKSLRRFLAALLPQQAEDAPKTGTALLI